MLDLKMWFRQPKLLGMSVVPLIIISLGVGLFMANIEVLPVGIILENPDPEGERLKDYLMELRSGTGLTWFATTDENVEQKYAAGEILGKIIIPGNLSEALESGRTVPVPIQINNITDDVTKNFMQRMQYALNHFNEGLRTERGIYHIPRMEFVGDISPDLPIISYL